MKKVLLCVVLVLWVVAKAYDGKAYNPYSLVPLEVSEYCTTMGLSTDRCIDEVGIIQERMKHESR